MIVDPAQDLRRPGRNTCNQRISAAIKAALVEQAFLGTAQVSCPMGRVVAVRRRKGQLLVMIRGWGRWYPVESVRIERMVVSSSR